MAKVETQILALSTQLSRAPMDSTTCDYTALRHNTIALEGQAKQLEASSPPP